MGNINFSSESIGERDNREFEFLRLKEELDLKADRLSEIINLLNDNEEKVDGYTYVLGIVDKLKSVVYYTGDVNLKIEIVSSLISFLDGFFTNWYEEAGVDVTKKTCFIKRLIADIKIKRAMKKRRKKLDEFAKILKTKCGVEIDVEKLSKL